MQEHGLRIRKGLDEGLQVRRRGDREGDIVVPQTGVELYCVKLA